MIEGKVIRTNEDVDEDGMRRLITVRGPANPWPGNPYEDYTFRDDEGVFKMGDTVTIELRKADGASS